MNKVFERNINALKDSALKEVLNNYEYGIKPILASTNGYNIQYDGVFLHNEESPLSEAKEIFKSAKNNKNSIHLIYGLGLGYLFQIASMDSQGIVVVYEPNMDILHNSFTLVDFSNDLAKKNVFFFTDFDALINFISDVSTNDSMVEIFSLPSYRNIYAEEFKNQTKQLELAFGSVLLDYSFKRKKLYAATANMIYNIPSLVKETPINVLENVYEGQTAVIVSAGPTLGENIETLKKYQDNAVIFSVGPALKTLIKNDIKADYLCIVESINCSQQVSGLDLSGINLILEPFTHPAIHALDVKNKYLHVSSNMPPSAFWGKVSHTSTEGYMTQGTVSYMALNTAVKMGFSKIILVGQDLAYIDGQCYSKDSAYEDLVCKFNEESQRYEILPLDFDKYVDALSPFADREVGVKCALRRIEALNSALYTVKGIDGKTIPTEAGYAAFIKQFADYASRIDGVTLINTSLKGAQINGFDNIPLEEAMKDSKKIEKTEFNEHFEYNIPEIWDCLEKLGEQFKQYDEQCNECGKIASRLSRDWVRHKRIDKDLLLKIRGLIETFTILNDVNNQENEIFMYTTAQEEMALADFLKTVVNYDEKTTPNVIEKLNEYYTLVKKRISNILKYIESSKEGLRK